MTQPPKISMSSRWLAANQYDKCVFVPKVRKVLQQIQEEYEPQLKDSNYHFVLVHPSPTTLYLKSVAESEPHFKRLVSTLLNGIDIKSMYARGLFSAMNMDDVITDKECCKAFSEMCSTFSQSKLMGVLQKFARDAVISGETFGWFALGQYQAEGITEFAVPYIDLDAVIVFISPLEKWVARSLDGQPLELHFLLHPGQNFKPLSTVSFMLPKYLSMQTIRDYHMRSLHYSSKPNFVSSTQLPDSQNKNRHSEVLDQTLVNQATMNDHLENLIDSSVRHCSLADSAQKRVQIQSRLHEYVSQMGQKQIKNSHEQNTLQKKVQLLEAQLAEIKGEMDHFQPYQYNLPEGLKIDSASLSVHPLDIVHMEEMYQREWFRVGTGMDYQQTLPRDEKVKSFAANLSREKSVSSPQQKYQEIIVNELLSDWKNTHKIPLATASAKQKEWSLTELMAVREILPPSRLSFLLSEVLDVPIEHILSHAKQQGRNGNFESD